MTWYGSTAGSNTVSTVAAGSSILSGRAVLAGIRFYAVDPATYTITVNGAAVGSVTSAGATVEEVTFSPVTAPAATQTLTIAIVPNVPVRFRSTAGGFYTYTEGLTQGGWEGTGRLPWELDLALAHPTEWVVSCPGVVTGTPHAMPGVVVNGGTVTPTRTVGQLWPTYHGAP